MADTHGGGHPARAVWTWNTQVIPIWESRDVPAPSAVHACSVVNQRETNWNGAFGGAEHCGVSVVHFLSSPSPALRSNIDV